MTFWLLTFLALRPSQTFTCDGIQKAHQTSKNFNLAAVSYEAATQKSTPYFLIRVTLV